MYQAIGVKTKKVYAVGFKNDIQKYLQSKYPYSKKEGNREILLGDVFPEPIKLQKILN